MTGLKRSYVANLLLILLGVALPLLGAEYTFRIIRVLAKKPPYYQSDPVLGWAPVPNADIKGMPVVSSDGNRYTVSFSTDSDGLRYSSSDWQIDPVGVSLRNRILVLGDSFTGDAYTSDSEAWFSYLNSNLGLPVYAYGIGGSGTYQQYLALKKIFPLVKPKVIVLQACSNDHSNNDPSSIYSSNIRNQELRRPYLAADGGSFFADGAYAKIYRALFASSQLFAFIDNQLAKKQVSFPFSHAPTLSKSALAIQTYGNTPEKMTAQSLRLFVSEARSRDPQVRIFGVLCASDQAKWWKPAFQALGVTYIHEPAAAVEAAEMSGKVVRINDFAHWNILGNRIFGQELAFRLRQHLGI